MNARHPYEERRDRLRQAAAAEGLDALLVTHAANRWYLSGFELHDPQCNESAGQLLITAQGPDWLLTDPRYEDAAKRLWPEDRLFIYTGDARARIRDFLKATVHGALGIEARAMHVDLFRFLSETLDLTPTTGLVEQLRLLKDPWEVACMERSCALNHRVFDQTPGLLEPGRSEAEIAWDIEKLFRDQGATELAFAPIVAVGPNGALPHAIPGQDKVTANCPVLVDVGGRLDHYCSDQTRTFWVGSRPSDAFLRTRDLVQEAQQRALERIGPGLPMAETYKAAWDFFASHGVEARFTHALGHGIGLETHESPSVGGRAANVFQPGMVVTVEPGLYYPEWGGVRWEFMVLVTENGNRIL